MEGDSRRNSVYDFSGLRVHPDGYRVHQSDRNLGLTGHRRHNIQDFRGWIADDAGGSVIAPRYRSRKRAPSSEAEYIEAQAVQGHEASTEEARPSEEPQATGKRKKRRKLQRSIKFAEDDSYISSLSLPTEETSNGPLTPSQDLLKNIHRLAAKYYDENGLLLNASRRYRKAKKLRKLHRLASPESMVSGAAMNEDVGMNNAEQAASEDNSADQQRVNRDMYRVLDGSVLVAIGIFTQEIVKKLLQPRTENPMLALIHPDDGISDPNGDVGKKRVPSPSPLESDEQTREGEGPDG